MSKSQSHFSRFGGTARTSTVTKSFFSTNNGYVGKSTKQKNSTNRLKSEKSKFNEEIELINFLKDHRLKKKPLGNYIAYKK